MLQVGKWRGGWVVGRSRLPNQLLGVVGGRVLCLSVFWVVILPGVKQSLSKGFLSLQAAPFSVLWLKRAGICGVLLVCAHECLWVAGVHC